MVTGDQVITVKRRVEADLLRLPGVHAVGVGSRFVQGVRTSELVIQVFVEHKRPLSEVPEEERIPSEIDGIKTDVIESGPPIEVSEDSAAYRPVRGGIQIQTPSVTTGNQTATSNGTLSCIATTTSGGVVALTNYHVVFDPPHYGLNSQIWQPGRSPCEECCSNELGTVLGGVYDSDVDAAVISVRPGTEWLAEIVEIGVIAGIAEVKENQAAAGYPVRKRGRTSRLTAGSVVSIDLSGSTSNSSGGVRNYTQDMEIIPVPLFAVGDFLKLKDLVTNLSTGASKLSTYLWGRFDAARKQVLANPKAASEDKQSALIIALNDILRGESVFDAERFAGIVLSSETESLRAKNPTGSELVRLNRLLLEDAYTEIKPVPLFPAGDPTDFRDFIGLRTKLRQQSDQVSRKLWQQFTQDQRDKLLEEPASPDPYVQARLLREQEDTLIAAFNATLRGPSIYDPALFDPTGVDNTKVRLSAESRRLLEANPTGVGLLRLNRSLLEDSYRAELWRRPSFAVAGDSGSLVVDDSGKVVALLYGADPETGTGHATPIKKVESKLTISIATANQSGVVRKVPVVGASGMSGHRPVLRPALRSGFFEAESLMREKLVDGALLPPSLELARWLRHAEEVRDLIRTNRRVAAAWRSARGPDIYCLLSGGIIGTDTEASDPLLWVGRLYPFLTLLGRYGSAALRADAAEASRVMGLLGRRSTRNW